MLTSEQVHDTAFNTVRFSAGYDLDEVDDLLDRLVDTLRYREQGTLGYGLSADELAGARFSLTKLREGYKPAEIDAFIEEAVDTLRVYEAMHHEAAAEPPAGANVASFATTGPSGAVYGASEVATQGLADVPGPGVSAAAASVEPAAQTPVVAATVHAAPLGSVVQPATDVAGRLGVNEIVHRMQSLQASQDGSVMNAPVQVRTPDGRTFSVAAIKSTSSGLVITLVD